MRVWLIISNSSHRRCANTHRRECLRSSSPAWRSQSCCARSCWACWSNPPSRPRCLRPAGRCSCPASSARRRTSGPWCSAATAQEGWEKEGRETRADSNILNSINSEDQSKVRASTQNWHPIPFAIETQSGFSSAKWDLIWWTKGKKKLRFSKPKI